MMWELQNLEIIRQLLVEGKYNEALQSIILFKRKNPSITDKKKIKAELLHIEILLRAGFLHDIAPKLEILSDNPNLEQNPDLKLDWLFLGVEYNQEIGNLAPAKSYLETAHQIIFGAKKHSHTQSTHSQSSSQSSSQSPSQSQITPHLHKYYQKLLFLEGIQAWYEGDIEHSLQKLEELLKITPKNSRSPYYIKSLTYYGMILCEKGDFTHGIHHLQDALKMERKLGDRVALAQILTQLGRIYHLQGHLDEALKHLQESIFIWENLGDFSQIRFNLAGIATIYRQKGDYHQALNYIKRSLAIAERIGNPDELSRFLLELIRINLAMDAIENAEIALARIFQLHSAVPNKKIELRYRLANALILKQKGRARDLYRAQSLFNSIIEEQLVEEEITQIALMNLCELLLVELRLKDDISLYEELERIIERLKQEAEKKGSHLLYAETFLLKAKLMLLKLNISEARNFLNQAQSYAENSGLLRIAMKISEEHDKLLAQQQLWSSYQLSEAPVEKRVELADIENYLSEIVHEKGIDAPQMINEIPVAFIMLDQDGKVLYFQHFTPYWQFDQNLLAGFLSAFNMMSDEVFSQTLERAKFGNFNVIVEKLQTFMLGYVFQGPSYFASKKMQDFGRELVENKVVMEELQVLKENPQINTIKSEVSERNLEMKEEKPYAIKYLGDLCESILIPEYPTPPKKASLPENS